MANIQARAAKDGTVSYRVQIRIQGSPIRRATFKRKTEAKRWAEQTEAAIRAGLHSATNEGEAHSLHAAIGRYVQRLEERQADGSAKQKTLLARWDKRLGTYALADVTPALIAKELALLLSENIGTAEAPKYRNAATANRYRAALSKLFTVAAREWQLVRENPVMRVRKREEAPGRVRYLTAAEQRELIKACRASPLPLLELIVLIALSTGMRRGEIRALRWSDIDLERKLIFLHQIKNRRVVPIVEQVHPLLEVYSKVRRTNTKTVFSHPTDKDKPLDFDHAFIDAVRSAGIEDFRFHDLRHTAASWLAMSGATTPEIAAVLGHTTLATAKRYAHLSEQAAGEIVNRMVSRYLDPG